MNQRNEEKLIDKGIEFLHRSQLSDGGFKSITVGEIDFKKEVHDSIFSSFLILYCLNEFKKGSLLDSVKNKTVKLLLRQKSNNWTFNYWNRFSDDFLKFSYPDDLDDTFCALAALKSYDKNLIGGDVLAHAINALICTESQEGGPYYTWITHEGKKWKDIDVVVNSNVAYFLSLEGVELENINELIKELILSEDYKSQYYSSEYSVIYFISRFYKAREAKKVIEFLLAKRNEENNWGNELDTSLACLSLLNLGCDIEMVRESVSWLALMQRENGSWERCSFVVERIEAGQRFHYGSSELTTAFCLNLFQKYNNYLEKKEKAVNCFDQGVIKIKSQIYSLVEKEVTKINVCSWNDFRAIKSEVLGDVNDDQIVLLPYFFKKALGKKGEKLNDDLIVSLGIISLYGWMAYAIYDDFFDQDGDPNKLVLANILLRYLSMRSTRLSAKIEGLDEFFCSKMNDIERANKWELDNCHFEIENGKSEIDLNFSFGNLSVLSNKSIGHSLGIVSILFQLGYRKDSDMIRNMENFFHHFIVARQLNDDMHDWENDLSFGQINFVSFEILRKWNRFDKKNSSVNLNMNNIDELRDFFWISVCDSICSKVRYHSQRARYFLKKMHLKGDISFFEKMISNVDNAAVATLKEKKETLKFIDSYKSH